MSKSATVVSKSIKKITVGQGKYAGQTNVSIQQAVDDLSAAGGGVVEVPSGTYMLHDALHLRSGVHVLGEKDTIFRKVPSVVSPLKGGVGFAQSDFLVAEPDKFHVGMGIFLTDERAGGCYDTSATIVARRGEYLIMSAPANHDYGAGAKGVAKSIFSLIDARHVVDAGIENLQLDGSDEPLEMNGCQGGGVFTFDSQRILIKGIHLKNFKGDGMSIQKCADVFIRSCQVEHCTGIGLHPGSGTTRYVFEDNNSHHNGGCGLFFCLNTRWSLIRNNRFENNTFYGIQVNERDSDHWIEGNTIRGNGWAGIGFNVWEIQSGHRLQIQNNTIGGNCTKEGSAEIWMRHPLADINLINNRLEPSANVSAVYVAPGSTGIYAAGNTVAGKAMQKSDISGDPAAVNFQQPARPLAVRPEDAPADAAIHLQIRQLPRFAAR